MVAVVRVVMGVVVMVLAVVILVVVMVLANTDATARTEGVCFRLM